MENRKKTYVVVYRTAAVRDAQVCSDPDGEDVCINDDLWTDLPNAEVFVGIYHAASADDAVSLAAAAEIVKPNALRAICCSSEDPGVRLIDAGALHKTISAWPESVMYKDWVQSAIANAPTAG